MPDYSEDDMNQSFVLDGMETTGKKGKSAKARKKMRDLENEFGSSDLSTTKKQKKKKAGAGGGKRKKDPNNTLQTVDMGASDCSIGIDDLNGSTDSLDASSNVIGGGVAPKKKKKKKKKIPNNKKLGEHFEASSPRLKRGAQSVTSSISGTRSSSPSRKRPVQMRDTNRLIRSRSAAAGLQRDDSYSVISGSRSVGGGGRPTMYGRRQNSAMSFGGSRSVGGGRSGPHGGTMIARQDSKRVGGGGGRPGLIRQRSAGSVRSHQSFDASGHRSLPPDVGMGGGGGGGYSSNNSYASTSDFPQPTPRRRPRAKSMDRSMSYSGPQTTGGFVRQNSMQISAGHPKMKRSASVSGPLQRSGSMKRPPMAKSKSRPSMGGKRPSMGGKTRSAGDIGSRQSTMIKQGNKSVLLVPMTAKEAEELRRNPSQFKKSHKYLFGNHVEVEETPPRSLVLIWAVVMAELGFDLGTTIIAFMALLEDDLCCGNQMNLGPIPISVTSPFFLLVIAELAFLCRAVVLTLWPSMLTKQNQQEEVDLEDPEREEEEKKNASRSICMKYFCCCMKWNAKLILKILNFLVLLNPFFGCVIAWMLLYQSNKTEAFWVLGLEGGSIVLHFVSVYLEGGLNSWCSLLFHCVPLVPFFISVTMVLIYLNFGGVCYIVNRNNFFYWGCEVCENGWPPINGTCIINGTAVPVSNNIFDVELTKNVTSLRNELLATTKQATYCQAENPGGPSGDFCFFSYVED